MIEQGFTLLIQAGLASQFLTVPGGFALQFPKDLISPTYPQAWCYRSILSVPTYLLNGQDALTMWDVQVDCHGLTMVAAAALARAIDNVLYGGFSGVLADVDNTRVQGIFRLPTFVDGFSDLNRSFVRSVEYRVNYYETHSTPFGNTEFTFYIDPLNGSDLNAGTTYNHAWFSTTAADALTLTGLESVGYLLSGVWYLYRKLNMTDDEALLAASLVSASASAF
jgi:hypothetical protein